MLSTVDITDNLLYKS